MKDSIEHARMHENTVSRSTPSSEVRCFPLEDVQEACLLRYYVEELSHWVGITLHNKPHVGSDVLTINQIV